MPWITISARKLWISDSVPDLEPVLTRKPLASFSIEATGLSIRILIPAVSVAFISKFTMTRLSQKALRLYDRKGLLVPEAKDPFTGYRYYTVSQLEQGMKIKTLCFLGFSLEEISLFLDAESKGDFEYIGTGFRKKLEQTRLEIGQLQRIEGILQGACKHNGKVMELFKMSVTEPVIKEIPEMRVISKREKGTFVATIGKLIGEICTSVGSPENQRNRVKVTGPVMFLCHDI